MSGGRTVEACRDQGICFLCGEQIKEGEGIYTLTHSHWRCYEQSDEGLADKREQFVGREEGGVITHLVEKGRVVALCGFEPLTADFDGPAAWTRLGGRKPSCTSCRKAMELSSAGLPEAVAQHHQDRACTPMEGQA